MGGFCSVACDCEEGGRWRGAQRKLRVQRSEVRVRSRGLRGARARDETESRNRRSEIWSLERGRYGPLPCPWLHIAEDGVEGNEVGLVEGHLYGGGAAVLYCLEEEPAGLLGISEANGVGGEVDVDEPA